jgi:hypothetical protein
VSLSLSGAGFYSVQAVNLSLGMYRQQKVVARLPAPDGSLLMVRGGQVKDATMLPPRGREPWGLSIVHSKGRDRSVPWWRYDRDTETTDIRGVDAMLAAAQLLPYVRIPNDARSKESCTYSRKRGRKPRRLPESRTICSCRRRYRLDSAN